MNESPQERTAADSNDEDRQKIAASHVLVVDDNTQNLELLVAYLEGLGCKVRTAIDGVDALDKVKTLEGILPICGVCKKIRSDDGYWNQLERYITEHSQAIFSHGLCPECYAKELTDFENELKKSATKTP